MALEKAKIRVERVVPSIAPDEPPTAYFHEEMYGAGNSAWRMSLAGVMG